MRGYEYCSSFSSQVRFVSLVNAKLYNLLIYPEVIRVLFTKSRGVNEGVASHFVSTVKNEKIIELKPSIKKTI